VRSAALSPIAALWVAALSALLGPDGEVPVVPPRTPAARRRLTLAALVALTGPALFGAALAGGAWVALAWLGLTLLALDLALLVVSARRRAAARLATARPPAPVRLEQPEQPGELPEGISAAR
jgi:hypothetical protein